MQVDIYLKTNFIEDQRMTESFKLYHKVIKKGFCIGCGACSVIKNAPFQIEFNDYGNLVAIPKYDLNKSRAKVMSICPFSGESKNEDEISDIIFPDIEQKTGKIGKFISCYAGYVKENNYRAIGSSGGIGKWLGSKLLEEKEVDYLFQVVSNNSIDMGNRLFDYALFFRSKDVSKGSKSSYYPVTLTNVIKEIRSTEGQFAITGVPCFIKALRLLALEDDLLRNRIKYLIGLICGGMKSANHASAIGWQLGIAPENLKSIDFRRKDATNPASKKLCQVWSYIDEIERIRDYSEIMGTDWIGSFRPKVCEYCDDIVSETADISIGDAWLPRYIEDPYGTSVVIVRNHKIRELLERHVNIKSIKLDRISIDDVVKSQAGGFRYRREALSFRLAVAEAKGLWYPPKRVTANQFRLTPKEKRIYSMRELISSQSHVLFVNALTKNDLKVFIDGMKMLFIKHRILTIGWPSFIFHLSIKYVFRIKVKFLEQLSIIISLCKR